MLKNVHCETGLGQLTDFIENSFPRVYNLGLAIVTDHGKFNF